MQISNNYNNLDFLMSGDPSMIIGGDFTKFDTSLIKENSQLLVENVNKLGDTFKSYGISRDQSAKLKKLTIQSAGKIVNVLKTENIMNTSRDAKKMGEDSSLSKSIKEFMAEYIRNLKHIITGIKIPKHVMGKIKKDKRFDRKKFDLGNYTLAFNYTMFAGFLNSFFFGAFLIALIGFGIAVTIADKIAMNLTAVFIAPITEEYFKSLSIDEGIEHEFHITFNVLEAFQYISTYGPRVGYFKIIVLRLTLPVAMHANTLATQMTIRKQLTKKGMDEVKSKRIGYWTAVAQHAFYNGLLTAL